MIIKRTGALGDVIMLTPVLMKLVEKHKTVRVITGYPYVVDGLIGVETADPSEKPDIDFDLVYERMPDVHPVLAYAEHADLSLEPWERQATVPIANISLSQKQRILDPRYKYAVVNPTVSWQSRTFWPDFWRNVISKLQSFDFKVILLGAPVSLFAGLTADLNLMGATSLAEAAWIISKVSLFVGPDSALLHVAGATATPIAALFTCVSPDVRLPWRAGKLGAGCVAISAKTDCRFCLATREPPWTTEPCYKKDGERFMCVRSITPEDVMEGISRLTGVL
jgi:ADP-heptose:LPS heptosyltransferase